MSLGQPPSERSEASLASHIINKFIRKGHRHAVHSLLAATYHHSETTEMWRPNGSYNAVTAVAGLCSTLLPGLAACSVAARMKDEDSQSDEDDNSSEMPDSLAETQRPTTQPTGSTAAGDAVVAIASSQNSQLQWRKGKVGLSSTPNNDATLVTSKGQTNNTTITDRGGGIANNNNDEEENGDDDYDGLTPSELYVLIKVTLAAVAKRERAIARKAAEHVGQGVSTASLIANSEEVVAAKAFLAETMSHLVSAYTRKDLVEGANLKSNQNAEGQGAQDDSAPLPVIDIAAVANALQRFQKPYLLMHSNAIQTAEEAEEAPTDNSNQDAALDDAIEANTHDEAKASLAAEDENGSDEPPPKVRRTEAPRRTIPALSRAQEVIETLHHQNIPSAATITIAQSSSTVPIPPPIPTPPPPQTNFSVANVLARAIPRPGSLREADTVEELEDGTSATSSAHLLLHPNEGRKTVAAPFKAPQPDSLHSPPAVSASAVTTALPSEPQAVPKPGRSLEAVVSADEDLDYEEGDDDLIGNLTARHTEATKPQNYSHPHYGGNQPVSTAAANTSSLIAPQENTLRSAATATTANHLPKMRNKTNKPVGGNSGKARYPYSAAEDAAILQGLGRFAGPQKWSDIYNAYSQVWLPGRTPVGLYDHWRSVLRGAELTSFLTL